MDTPALSPEKVGQKPKLKKPFEDKVLLDNYIQDSLRKVERQLDQERKQHRAESRRKTLLFLKQNKAMDKNAKEQKIITRAKHARQQEDLKNLDRSFKAKKSNDEFVFLRKAYTGLYKEELALKVSEQKLTKQRQDNAKKHLHEHVELLENLFKERVELLKEQQPKLDQQMATM